MLRAYHQLSSVVPRILLYRVSHAYLGTMAPSFSSSSKASRPSPPSSSSSTLRNEVKEEGATKEPKKAKVHDDGEIRLVKRIANSREMSRRDSVIAIKEGRVSVNGKTATDPAVIVRMTDSIAVNGKYIAKTKSPVRLWLAHKLKGELITNDDPNGRPTLFQRLHAMGLPDNLIAVGRLDFNTEGLILLTNSGDFSRFMEHPTSDIVRVYKAKVRGRLNESWLKSLRRGVMINGIKYKPLTAYVEKVIGDKTNLVHVECSEGKNHHVRNIFEHMNLYVSALQRTQYGPYSIKGIPKGAVKEARLDNKLKRSFMKSLKEMVTKESGKEKGGKPQAGKEKQGKSDFELMTDGTDDEEEESISSSGTSKVPTITFPASSGAPDSDTIMCPARMDIATLRRAMVVHGLNIMGGKKEMVDALNFKLGIKSVDMDGVIQVPETVKSIKDIDHLRVIDLKAALKERSLVSSGKKMELQARLFEHLTSASS